jgi:hypothetical protein
VAGRSATRVTPAKAGLALGAAIAVLHAAWAVLVLSGWAQPLADFLFWIHFIQPVYVIMPFDLGRAGLLVLVSGAGGFILGWVLAQMWNLLQSRSLETR